MSETDRQDHDTGVRELGADEDIEAVLTDADRALLDFSAVWCGPCQLMEPVLEEIALETPAPIVKIDVETHPVIAAEYDVSAVPTYVVLEAGDPTERFVGAQDKGVLLDALEG